MTYSAGRVGITCTFSLYHIFHDIIKLENRFSSLSILPT